MQPKDEIRTNMDRPISYAALFLASLLISGCDKDFATLTFERSVRTDRDGLGHQDAILPDYREQLAELIRAQGVDPDLVRPRVTDGIGRKVVLSEPIFGGLEPEQKAALQQAFEDIVKQREKPIGMTVILRPENMEHATETTRQKAAELPRQYDTKVELHDVALSISFGLGDMLNAAMQGARAMNSQSYCNVTARVKPALPFFQLMTGESEQKSVAFLLVKSITSPYSRDSIPADVRFESANLQALLEQEKIVISSNLTENTQSFRNSRGLTQFEILIGQMGIIQHEHSKVDIYSHNSLKTECEAMASALGRPFSFHMGDSIDRLASVIFY